MWAFREYWNFWRWTVHTFSKKIKKVIRYILLNIFGEANFTIIMIIMFDWWIQESMV